MIDSLFKHLYRIHLTLEDFVAGDSHSFVTSAKRLGYLENSFPDTKETTDACVDIGLELLGRKRTADDRITIGHALRKMVATE